MNSELEQKRLKNFLTTLGIAALAINLLCLGACHARNPARPDALQNASVAPALVIASPAPVSVPNQQDEIQRQQQDEAARKSAEEHAAFLRRYIDIAFAKSPGVQTVALSVSAGNGKTDRAVANALVLHFKNSGVQIVPSFFKSAFVEDGLFDNAFNGSGDVPSKLELAKVLDELLLARESVEYSTNGAELQNTITTAVRLEVSVVPVSGLSTGQTWAFTASGVGFSQGAALTMAQERLVKQIAEDNKMAL